MEKNNILLYDIEKNQVIVNYDYIKSLIGVNDLESPENIQRAVKKINGVFSGESLIYPNFNFINNVVVKDICLPATLNYFMGYIHTVPDEIFHKCIERVKNRYGSEHINEDNLDKDKSYLIIMHNTCSNDTTLSLDFFGYDGTDTNCHVPLDNDEAADLLALLDDKFIEVLGITKEEYTKEVEADPSARQKYKKILINRKRPPEWGDYEKQRIPRLDD